MNCPACDSANRPGAQRCKRCAAPMPPSCRGCGSKVQPGVDLCPSCRTERVPAALGADELFGVPVEAEPTAIMSAPYEMRPRFVGRQGALDRMMKAFDDARDLRELAFVAVIGPPGSGKTRIIKELSRHVKQRTPQARFLMGPAGGTVPVPYGAFSRLLATRFGIGTADAPELARDKITAGVGDVLPAARVVEVAHLIAHLMRVGYPESPIIEPLAESPQQLEARTFIAVKRFLAADAEKAPLVLCLDELERAGAETVNLLHYLAAGLMSSPVMLLAVARPILYDVHPTFGDGEAPLERIDLGPLDDHEAESLVRELLKPVADAPAALVEHAKKLGGMPRTLFEFVRLLLEAEVIVRGLPPIDRGADAGLAPRWTVDTDRLARLRLPEHHEEILTQRLRQMAPAERDLLEKAAVCGERFWLDAVVALVRVAALDGADPDGPTLGEIAAAGDRTRLAVAQTLSRLVEREWLVESSDSQIIGEREYVFAYPPLWDVVYEGIDEASRRRYHRLIAQWLELRPEGRGEEPQEEIGRHLERAGDGDGAATRYRRAADAARARYYNDKAIRLYAQALACLGEGDMAARIHIWHDLGSVYELKGDFEQALGAFERMLRLTWVVSSRTKAAVAFNKMGRVFRRKGDLRLALDYLGRGQELFEQAGDLRGVAGSLDDVGHVMWLLGRYDDAFEKITQALQKRGQGGDKRSIAHSLSTLGNVQKDRGRFAEAENCYREALALRRDAGDRAGVITTLNNLAVLAFERGDKDGARNGWEEALAEAEDIGALPLQALALNNLGELALVEGKLEEARRRLEETISIAKDLDERLLLSEATRNLGLLELEGGNSGLAHELTTRALEIAESSGLRDYVGRALLALAEVHAATLFDADEANGETGSKAADDFFTRGVELFRQMGNEGELAKGLERFGRYKLERGDIEAGRVLIREAHALFQKLGMKKAEDITVMDDK
jgi:tetratricopeptide (TPR) repeat protein